MNMNTFMYIGNLERYQGIDLLLRAFTEHRKENSTDRLVIIGGMPKDVRKYRDRADAAGLGDAVEFRGHQPVSRMADFFSEADVLVSPRIKGSNTPMKIYSYLAAGKPILATDLTTHTQVLTPDVAFLAKPNPEALAEGMRWLATHRTERAVMGAKARELLATRYSRKAFEVSVDEICASLEARVSSAKRTAAS
jgi:glycosyltransferase involved in cell wall biosynthesis